MLVSYRMTKEPITVELDDLLSQAAHKMKTGRLSPAPGSKRREARGHRHGRRPA